MKTKKGRYYNTHNYLIHTDDIYGEWSEPVYLNSIGFDPSLFHDTDGKKYLVNMVNGFKGVLVQELDENFRPVGERRKVYGGTAIGCTEGPHMYHIGKWYYLLTAEGGTGYRHCVTMARSESLWGPFETAPDNPVLTSDQNDLNALQKCGHGDLVETAGGEWYMVHLCARPLNGEKWCTLGRETAIQKVVWDQEGWLLQSGGRYAELTTESPAGLSGVPLKSEENGFYDDFDSKTLHVRYCSPRADYTAFADCTARPGYLRIRGQEALNSMHHVSLLAVRQQRICCVAETELEFEPQYPEQLAGLCYLYDAMNFYLLGKTTDETGAAVLTLLKSDGGIITDEIQPVPVSAKGQIKLRVQLSEDGTQAVFSYCVGNEKWVQAGEPLTTELLTDEHCRGFTGACFGMYAHDMAGMTATADFGYFCIKT